MKLLLGFLVLIVVVNSQTPASPVWPNEFWQPFNETMKYTLFNHYTSGEYYYNWNIKAYRVDRANGRYDRYCGLLGPYEFENTPCSHIVNNGNRFLYYKEKNHCCFCCNADHGCGMLFPGWMTNATYIDQEIHDGVMTYKWNKKGVQDNFFYETVNPVPVNRVTVAIYQVPDDDMNFGPRSPTVPPGTLDLPSICSLNTKCETAACIALREGKETFSSRI